MSEPREQENAGFTPEEWEYEKRATLISAIRRNLRYPIAPGLPAIIGVALDAYRDAVREHEAFLRWQKGGLENVGENVRRHKPRAAPPAAAAATPECMTCHGRRVIEGLGGEMPCPQCAFRELAATWEARARDERARAERAEAALREILAMSDEDKDSVWLFIRALDIAERALSGARPGETT